MIALKIAEVKDFMNKLLCQDVFDHFLIQEAIITTNVSCHIDGTLQKDFYTFLFQVFPPVIAGKSQTHPLPDRKFFHGK